MSGADLRSTVSGETYALIADLSLQIDSYGLEPLSEQMTAERTRRTTLIRLVGDGEEGVGEDATPIEAEQLAFQERAASLLVAGQWTIDSFSAHVSNLELIPPGPHERARSFRQWGFESAALDLALRQAARSLADVLGRACRPVTFVNSMHLPEPPSPEPIRQRLHLFPGLRLKLDPTTDWDERLIAEIAATGAVDTVDLKSQYPPPFGQPADPELYERIVRAFRGAWIEDPAITPETRPVLEPHARRITWDAPLHSVADIQELSTRPRAINIKPVRFASLKTLFEVYDYCATNDIAMYGGGFGELGAGRHHLQYLASLFHPDAPNDVAPSGYNRPVLDPALPASPIAAVPAATGFRWAG
jgi:hypothetical protein